MAETTSFSAKSKFYAQEYFPFGLDRSGEFTVEQTKLLIEHGKAYQALSNGLQEPVTDEEIAFVAVCKGEKEASTPHEKAWMRFCEKTQSRGSVSAFGSQVKTSANDEQYEESSDQDW